MYHDKVATILENINKVIIGKQETALLSIMALLAGGHVLLEDVPGVGKTMLVRSIAKSFGTDFKRIQFTPDLLPSDITGASIYNAKENDFEFRPGPLMAHIVLADEINRTSPKTQAALLEAMEEQSVTVDSVTRQLPRPFFVMATQNPIDFEGTYPLPEAQLDRFLIKINMGYPEAEDEYVMLSRMEKKDPIQELTEVLTVEELVQLQMVAKQVHVNEEVKRYIVNLVRATREHTDVELGVSPRGSIALMQAAQAYALIVQREYVLPDDVQYLAPFVLSHRILLTPEAQFTNVTAVKLVNELLQKVEVPIVRRRTL
ncbi:AAA family ATPase [Bacillus solimangrovi]|uniref:AAA family ATPase n=1 Tax=Bacillus solimangrovi TaxID=1305675 RepID=A0A1E5LD17_9BACI|nr:MoxR family ATPase [Bacillus solimangrovi]OEH91977.1 AAA family ATPase [Bacillus solimangrovi]